MLHAAAIFVRRGRAFVPTQATLEGEGAGALLIVEPIYVCKLAAGDLALTLESLVAQGHPCIPTPKLLGYPPSRDPMLRATGVRSWRQLAKGGASYSIWWGDDAVVLYMSRHDKKGRLVTDETKTRQFPQDVSIRTLVEAILEDVHMRPELLEGDA
jgi:hypothetical protein